MKIKSKLKITTIVSIFSIIFCLFMLANTFLHVRQASQLEKRSDEVIKEVFELTMLTNDYLVNKNVRAEQQWQIKHRQLSDLIQKTKAKGNSQSNLLAEMYNDHNAVKKMFQKLLSINNRPDNMQSRQQQHLLDRIIGQISITAQDIVVVAFQLNKMAKSDLLSAQKQGAVIIITLMAILSTIIVINSLLLGRSIAKPIINLQKDIQKIGSGDFSHDVSYSSNDEIGELAANFKYMTSNLKNATLSLAENKKMLEKVTMGITDAIIMIDKNFKIIWTNENVINSQAKVDQEIIGQYCYAFIHQYNQPCSCVGIECPISQVNETCQPATVIHQHNDIFNEITVYPVLNKSGDFVQYVHVTRDISERMRLHENIKRSEDRYRSLFNDALDMIHIVDDNGVIVDANPAELHTLGYTQKEYIGKQFSEVIHPDYVEQTKSYFQKVLSGETVDIYETVLITKAGDSVEVEVNAVPKKNDSRGIRAVLRNISYRKKLESQLIQSQKMEAIGTLAGGIAHDFNNMLGVILGHSELLMDGKNAEDPDYENLTEILEAAQRSADLTRQLLAFARKQTIEPKVLDINNTVDGMLKMLARLLGEEIDLVWKPETDICPVKFDPAQIDQILANLCVNARDAISGVGKVTVETKNVFLDRNYCSRHLGFKPGQYVMLAISDNGCGMENRVKAKVFEPFFTTKETGKGTGLGLATVYGIVKQNNGFINVYSEVGKGTTFKVYMPINKESYDKATDALLFQNPKGRREVVLLVEDEIGLLSMIKRLLEKLNYIVITANSPQDALELAYKNSNSLDLLITDVVMPEMSGKDLSNKIKSFSPDIKVLYMSGYTANAIAHHGVLDQGVHFIQKPFSVNSFSIKLREILEPSYEQNDFLMEQLNTI